MTVHMSFYLGPASSLLDSRHVKLSYVDVEPIDLLHTETLGAAVEEYDQSGVLENRVIELVITDRVGPGHRVLVLITETGANVSGTE